MKIKKEKKELLYICWLNVHNERTMKNGQIIQTNKSENLFIFMGRYKQRTKKSPPLCTHSTQCNIHTHLQHYRLILIELWLVII
jgi:hypothetical protein